MPARMVGVMTQLAYLEKVLRHAEKRLPSKCPALIALSWRPAVLLDTRSPFFHLSDFAF